MRLTSRCQTLRLLPLPLPTLLETKTATDGLSSSTATMTRTKTFPWIHTRGPLPRWILPLPLPRLPSASTTRKPKWSGPRPQTLWTMCSETSSKHSTSQSSAESVPYIFTLYTSSLHILYIYLSPFRWLPHSAEGAINQTEKRERGLHFPFNAHQTFPPSTYSLSLLPLSRKRKLPSSAPLEMNCKSLGISSHPNPMPIQGSKTETSHEITTVYTTSTSKRKCPFLWPARYDGSMIRPSYDLLLLTFLR